MPITRDDWMAALQEVDPVTTDPDYLAAFELAVIWGCSNSTAGRRAKDLVVAGRAVLGRKRANVGGSAQRVPAYKLLPLKKQPSKKTKLAHARRHLS